MSKKKLKSAHRRPKSEESDTKDAERAEMNETPKANVAVSDAAKVSAEELEELRRKSSEFDQLTDQLKRVAAEFQNYRRRVEQERDSWTQHALQKLVLGKAPLHVREKPLEDDSTGSEETTEDKEEN